MTQVRRLTFGGQLFELLRLRILSGEMAAGTRVILDEVAAELGVSRISARDALKRLESEGLLQSDEMGRYTVASFSSDDAVEVYAIRQRLEPLEGNAGRVSALWVALSSSVGNAGLRGAEVG